MQGFICIFLINILCNHYCVILGDQIVGNLLALITEGFAFFAKAQTTLSAAQQAVTLTLNSASTVAKAAGATETAQHLDNINSAVAKDASLADAFLHLFSLPTQKND